MEKIVATRIDGMIMGAMGNLNAIASYIKNNCEAAEAKTLIRKIGGSMAELIEIADSIHAEYPDIIPQELRPPNSE
ncbi:hypothetical protein FP026_25910 [Rhizobium tropici]|uniref:Uncharacterized protein n=1 Tax=Rhizobium tropici TaxID=398 RepID=A0A5B0VQN2_RHITR|nr:hypothetical protein [Rhizobium tropici]KAA1177000.1 hypothetical protein FP026_25910 [Rhizobium tropici]